MGNAGLQQNSNMLKPQLEVGRARGEERGGGKEKKDDGKKAKERKRSLQLGEDIIVCSFTCIVYRKRLHHQGQALGTPRKNNFRALASSNGCGRVRLVL